MGMLQRDGEKSWTCHGRFLKSGVVQPVFPVVSHSMAAFGGGRFWRCRVDSAPPSSRFGEDQVRSERWKEWAASFLPWTVWCVQDDIAERRLPGSVQGRLAQHVGSWSGLGLVLLFLLVYESLLSGRWFDATFWSRVKHLRWSTGRRVDALFYQSDLGGENENVPSTTRSKDRQWKACTCLPGHAPRSLFAVPGRWYTRILQGLCPWSFRCFPRCSPVPWIRTAETALLSAQQHPVECAAKCHPLPHVLCFVKAVCGDVDLSLSSRASTFDGSAEHFQRHVGCHSTDVAIWGYTWILQRPSTQPAQSCTCYMHHLLCLWDNVTLAVNKIGWSALQSCLHFVYVQNVLFGRPRFWDLLCCLLKIWDTGRQRHTASMDF